MARARAAESPRSKPKAVLIEETSLGISKFQELLAAIADFNQEGFPYRDASRSKAELQFRECVRLAFGERSQEFQTYRNHKLRTSTKAEVAQSIAVVKGLMQTLEDKRLELQGLKPPPIADTPAETSPAPPPQMTLVPPTAQVTMAPQPAGNTQPITLSVAMTTNLGKPVASTSGEQPSPPDAPKSGTPAPQPGPPMPQAPVAPAPEPSAPLATAQTAQATPPPHQEEPATTKAPTPSTIPPVPPIPALREVDASPAQPPAGVNPTRMESTLRSEPRSMPPAPTADKSDSQPPAHSPAPAGPAHSARAPEKPSTGQPSLEARSIQSHSEQEPLQLLRKVCLRFHSVARQLRLRKDYRATLEVEDDYDLQDLLCALLKVEFDEVGVEEWTPPYTGGEPRTTLFLNRDQIAVVAKKTRAGLTAKELAEQVVADSAYYRAQDKCATLFCFIYDPEGRIGSPKRLETNLTSVSERCTVEVLVAPK